MDRLFSVFVLLVLLALAPAGMRAGCIEERAQPVFFSMLFPQLIPECIAEKTEEQKELDDETSDEQSRKQAKAVKV